MTLLTLMLCVELFFCGRDCCFPIVREERELYVSFTVCRVDFSDFMLVPGVGDGSVSVRLH